jgi:Relaxase/Mobilisation nuclease domain
MSSGPCIDGVLVQWGEPLFYPGIRIVKSAPTPRLDTLLRRQAAVIRKRIEATVRQAPQVMVKVTGGGRGMAAIAAHFQYITRNGRLEIEDDREVVRMGKEALRDLEDQWRYGGSLIPKEAHRNEAIYIVLSMRTGTDPARLQKAAREFAQTELAGHRYVMVLHEHDAHPHVHVSVRMEAASGKRLRPSTADLHRWRETFAEKLRSWGVDAEATRQATRGVSRNSEPLWRIKAKEQGLVRTALAATKNGRVATLRRADAMVCWAHIMKALAASDLQDDRQLAERIGSFVRGTPFVQDQWDQASRQRHPTKQPQLPAADRDRQSQALER